MSIIAITASTEATLGFFPAFMYVNTTDTYADVQAIGYVDGVFIQPTGYLTETPVFRTGQLAVVVTSDQGAIIMDVVVDDFGSTTLLPKVT